MYGNLRIFRTEGFEISKFYDFINRYRDLGGRMHFLVSDGIIVDFLHMIPEDLPDSIIVQRILTSYQLQRILMDSDSDPHFIAIRSGIISSWPLDVVQSIYDVMRIKSYYHNCGIYVNIVGQKGIFENYLGKMLSVPVDTEEREGGLYQWEEQP